VATHASIGAVFSGEWKEWFSAEGGATLDEIAAAAILQQQKLVNGVV